MENESNCDASLAVQVSFDFQESLCSPMERDSTTIHDDERRQVEESPTSEKLVRQGAFVYDMLGGEMYPSSPTQPFITFTPPETPVAPSTRWRVEGRTIETTVWDPINGTMKSVGEMGSEELRGIFGVML